ncbi:IclR family transcriptional regulator [Azospirillum sp. B2RO_4]|uniref:IclR family transcriptional regulator n=1 Tax=Azospirillum sp. B2RO_4 TaxID=3027796 RepID=UPI003DAA3C91
MLPIRWQDRSAIFAGGFEHAQAEEALVADDLADDEKDPRFVTALARGLELLRAFRRNESMLGNLELAQRTGLPKPTVSRLTYTLSKLGYLAYDQNTGKYRLGTSVLAPRRLSGMGIRQVARPLMQELADQTGLAVALGGRDRLSMIYLECCKATGPITPVARRRLPHQAVDHRHGPRLSGRLAGGGARTADGEAGGA